MGIVREWVDKSRSEDSRDNSEKYDIHYVNVECSDSDLVVVCFIASSLVICTTEVHVVGNEFHVVVHFVREEKVQIKNSRII